MNCHTKWVGVALVAFLAGGCGTAQNLNPSNERIHWGMKHPPEVVRVYGGVQNDLSAFSDLRWDEEYSFLNVLAIPLISLDLPLSVVGDTLTLPLAIVLRSVNDYYFPQKPRQSEASKELPKVSTP